MLHLLCGPRGAGKRMRLLDQVKSTLASGVQQMILVPETMSHTWERSLLEHCGNRAGQTCRVVSFSSLSKRILSQAGHAASGALDAGGKILTMYRAIRAAEPALTYYSGVAQKPALVSGMLDLCEEFQSCRITPAQLLESGDLGDKIRDMGLIYAQYRELCLAQGGTSMDRMALAAELAKSVPELAGSSLLVYGFSGFTQMEYAMLRSLLSVCGNVTVALMLEDDPDLFAEQHRTKGRLERLAADCGVGCTVEQLRNSAGSCDLDYLKEHFLDYGAEPYRGEYSRVRLYQAADTGAECELAAAICRERMLSGRNRLREIAVVCGNMDSYRDTLSRAFARYEVPVYLTQPSELLQKTPVAAVLAALQAVQDGYRTETMLTYLKSGLLALDRRSREQMENYMTLWKIQGNRWERPWTWSTDGYESAGDPQLLAQLEQLRRSVIAPLSGLREGLRRAHTGGELAACLNRFLKDLGYEQLVEARMRHLDRAGRKQEAAEYAQVYQIMEQAIAQMAAALEDLELRPEEMLYLLRLELSQYKIGSIPVSVDSVNVGDFTRIGSQDVDLLIVLGAVEGQFPPVSGGSSLLSEQERIRLEGAEIYLTQSESMRCLEQESMLYRAISGTGELMLVQPGLLADGNEARTSHVMKFITDLLPGMPRLDAGAVLRRAALTARAPAMELACCQAGGNPVPGGEASKTYFQTNGDKEEYFTQLSGYGRGTRGPIRDVQVVNRLYGDRIRLSATRADRVNACKFSYFMQYGLRAKANRPAQLGATQVGTFLHAVVETCVRLLEGRPEEEYRDVVMEQVRVYAANLGGLDQMTAREQALYASMGNMALEIVRNIMEELKNSDFRPLAFEMDFGKNDQPALELTEGDLKVSVNGSIDRVDGYLRGDTLYLKVIDYKTGKKEFALSDVLSGINLQMFLYLLMIERSGTERILHAAAERGMQAGVRVEPAAALYIPAKVDYSKAGWNDSAEDRQKMSDKARRRIGVVVENPDLIQALEHPTEERFRFLPIDVTKGGYKATSALITAERMGKLVRRVEQTVLQLGRTLKEGCVEADPYRKDGDHTACDWCDFRAACMFDETMSRDTIRTLPGYGREEINEILDREEDDHGDQLHTAAAGGHRQPE